MKKHLLHSLFIAGMLAVSSGAQAQVPEGKVYIKNVQTGLWWGAANEWGTHASLIPHADYVTLAKLPEGTYTMETQVSNGGTSYYFGGEWMDGGATPLTIEQNGSYYNISLNGNYFGTAGNDKGNGTELLGQNVSGDAALWDIFTEEAMNSMLNEATAANPVDATFLIADHTFGRNNRGTKDLGKDGVWKVSEDCTNYNLMGGNSNRHGAESYHSVFTISQTLENVPNGVYSFTAQGFYRQDGSDNDNLAEFFINNDAELIPQRSGSENSMNDACNSFEAGQYKIAPIVVEVSDNTINLGVRNLYNTTLWVIWDNFELTYYGANVSVDEVKNAAILKEMNDLVEKANALLGELEGIPSVKAIVEDALAEAASASGADAINAAINSLKDAIQMGQAYINAKDVLPKMEELVNSTNVYTAEALAAYYTEPYNKFMAGTITAAEAAALEDPFAQRGWHEANTVDDLLLSAWSIGDVKCNNYDAALYINTWSVEGNNDGTEFRVPFFEYWTSDGNSLGKNTLTATLTDVPAGDYKVSAWVRLRMKDGATAPAYGVTLQANDGEAVNVTGDAVANTQFFIGNFTATCEVGEDGMLNIKFNVAEDNNVSWLSFKNVKYKDYFVFPEGAVVYDFEAVAAAGENPANKNGSAANGQSFYGWENAEKTDSKRQDYRGYEWAEGSLLPEDCHVWRRSDRINGNIVEGGLKCPSNKEMAVDGLTAGDKVIIVYDATGAAENSKEIVWAIGDGTSEGGPGSDRATATIDGVEAVTGETTIASGAEITVNSVTPADNGTGYIVFQVKKGMIIKQIATYDYETVSISNVATAEKVDNAIYNLAGQRVKNAQKGLYIQNGKKVIVK